MPSVRLDESRSSRRQRSNRIRAGVEAILTDDVLPGERFDLTNAKRVLDYVLRKPAEEVKAKTIADMLGLDPRSVNRYLDVLERRFLTHELPNFLRSSKTSSRVTAKLYPADTSLSAEWLAAQSFDQLDDDERGHLFETFVVQQLRAHMTWSAHGVSLYHWRDTRKGRTKEVDLVIEAADGSLTAIEVESSLKPRTQDFNGIRNFREQYPDRFARGFVISPAGSPAKFGDDLWALPVAALRDRDAWGEPRLPASGPDIPDPPQAKTERAEKVGMTPSPSSHRDSDQPSSDTQIFVSYAHRDNEGLYEGKITQFVEDVREVLELEHEWSANIVWDETFMKWGDDLEARIEKELADSALFIPFVSPSYVRSEWCRREFVQFSDAAARANVPLQSAAMNLVLPVIWTPPRAFREQSSNDPVLDRVRSTIYIEAMDARTKPRGSQEYLTVITAVAEGLAEILEQRAQSARADETSGPLNEDSRDLTEVLGSIEELQSNFEADLVKFSESFEELSLGFQTTTTQQPLSKTATARDLLNWAERARRSLQGPSERLEVAAAKVQQDWDQMTQDIAAFVAIANDSGQEVPAAELSALAADLEESTRGLPDSDLEQMETIARALPRMSRRLSPVSQALLKAVGTIRGVSVSADGWLSSIYRSAGVGDG